MEPSAIEAFVTSHMPAAVSSPSTIPSIIAELANLHPSEEQLISATDLFMWGSMDSGASVAELQKLGVPSKICGKMVDVIWFCEQCCSDGTSCYCNDCFDKEQHKGHKYNYVVGGSGLCDCGDSTAIRPEGFCKVHIAFQDEQKILEKYLPLVPEHTRKAAPIAIKIYMGMLDTTLVQDLSDNKNVQTAMQTATMVLSYLGYLCGISPIFQHWIEEGFDAIFPEHFTTHKCKTKYFVSAKQRANYEQTMKSASQLSKGPEGTHQCTCSVLELIMGVYSLLIQQDEVYAFISQLIKQRIDFPPKALLAFCQNMYPVLTHLELDRLEQFETAIAQFLNGAWAEYVVKNPEYCQVLFQMCRDFFAFCDVAGGRAEISAILFTQIFSPFASTRPGTILANRPAFWTQFIAVAASNELIGYSDSLELQLAALAKTSGVQGIFSLLMHYIDIQNEELVSHILVQLKSVMEKSAATAIAHLADKNYFAVECERMCGWILSMMLTHYLLEGKLTGDAQAIRKGFREKVMKLMKVDDPAKFDSFIDDTMNMSVKVMSFVTRFRETPHLLEFMNTRYFQRDIEHFFYSDTCVLNMTLLLSSKPWRLIELIDQHFKFDWEGKSMKTWSESEIRPVNDRLELMLYLLLSSVGNDLPMLYEYFSASFQARGMNVSYRYRGRALLDYLLPKRVATAYLKRDKLFADLRGLDSELEAELHREDMAPLIDQLFDKKKAAKEVLFSLKSDALPYVNILWDGSFARFGSYEEKLRTLLSHLYPKGESKFNTLEWATFKPLEPVYTLLSKALLSMGLFQRLAVLLAGHPRLSERAGIFAGMLMYRMFRQCTAEDKSKLKAAMPEGCFEALRKIAAAHPAFDVGIRHMLAEILGHDENKGPAADEGAERERMKEKQKAVMAQFAAKQKVFMEKQGKDAKFSEEKEEKKGGTSTKTCVICREELRAENFAMAPFGLLVAHTFSGVGHKSDCDLLARFTADYKDAAEIEPSPLDLKLSSALYTCGHYVHIKCVSTYINQSGAYSGKNCLIFPCPLCKSYCKTVLPETSALDSESMKMLAGVEGYKQHINSMMGAISPHENDTPFGKLLIFMAWMIEGNVSSLSLLGMAEFQKHRSEPVRLFLWAFLQHAILKGEAVETLIKELTERRKKLGDDIKQEDIMSKNAFSLAVAYLAIGQLTRFLVSGSKAKSEPPPLADDTYKATVSAIIMQIVWKDLSTFWCKNKHGATRDLSGFKLDKQGLIRRASLEFSKLRCCFLLGAPEPASEEDFAKLCADIQIPTTLVDEVADCVVNILSHPTGEVKLPMSTIIEKAFVRASKTPDKVAIPRYVIFLGEKKAVHFIALPKTFRAFYENQLTKVCPSCPNKCNNISVCLFCGAVVCITDCCGVDEERTHGATCVGVDGVFLEVKSGRVKVTSEVGTVMLDSVYTNPMGMTVSSLLNSRCTCKDTALDEYTLNAEEIARLEAICSTGMIGMSAISEAAKNEH